MRRKPRPTNATHDGGTTPAFALPSPQRAADQLSSKRTRQGNNSSLRQSSPPQGAAPTRSNAPLSKPTPNTHARETARLFAVHRTIHFNAPQRNPTPSICARGSNSFLCIHSQHSPLCLSTLSAQRKQLVSSSYIPTTATAPTRFTAPQRNPILSIRTRGNKLVSSSTIPVALHRASFKTPRILSRARRNGGHNAAPSAGNACASDKWGFIAVLLLKKGGCKGEGRIFLRESGGLWSKTLRFL